MCPSTTKYFSPLLSYKVPPKDLDGCGTEPVITGSVPQHAASKLRKCPGLRPGHQVETQVLGRVLGVGEHDRPVFLVDHPAVVGGHGLLELRGVEPPRLLAGCLGDL